MTSSFPLTRVQVTRVEFTVALREHFSLPFVFAQFATVGVYLEEKNAKREVMTECPFAENVRFL